MRKIAIINFKGGTGKTTTAVNLSAGLAMKGRKVLLIDNDPSGNATAHLGAAGDHTLGDLLKGDVPVENAVTPVRRDLDIIPADNDLAKVESSLYGERYRERILSRRLEDLNTYDYVIIDNPPTQTLLVDMALDYCTEVIAPISSEFLSILGIGTLIDTINVIAVENSINLSLIVPTFYDARTKKSEEILRVLISQFGNLIAEPIRINCRLSEAPAHRQTIFEYAPKSYGAIDYSRLTERILNG